MTRRLPNVTRRTMLVGGGAVVGGGVAFGLGGQAPFAGRPVVAPEADPAILNDASGLGPVKIVRHATVSDTGEKALSVLRAELAEARSAARHSMGAQSLSAGGTAATLDQAAIDIDAAEGSTARRPARPGSRSSASSTPPAGRRP